MLGAASTHALSDATATGRRTGGGITTCPTKAGPPRSRAALTHCRLPDSGCGRHPRAPDLAEAVEKGKLGGARGAAVHRARGAAVVRAVPRFEHGRRVTHAGEPGEGYGLVHGRECTATTTGRQPLLCRRARGTARWQHALFGAQGLNLNVLGAQCGAGGAVAVCRAGVTCRRLAAAPGTGSARRAASRAWSSTHPPQGPPSAAPRGAAAARRSAPGSRP